MFDVPSSPSLYSYVPIACVLGELSSIFPKDSISDWTQIGYFTDMDYFILRYLASRIDGAVCVYLALLYTVCKTTLPRSNGLCFIATFHRMFYLCIISFVDLA